MPAHHSRRQGAYVISRASKEDALRRSALPINDGAVDRHELFRDAMLGAVLVDCLSAAGEPVTITYPAVDSFG